MGCCASSPARAPDTVEPRAVTLGISDGKAAAPSASDPAARGDSADTLVDSGSNAAASKWSLMENAEEKGFLQDEDSDVGLDELLEEQFPQLKSSRSRYALADTWRTFTHEVPMEEGDFVLQPPWTIAQAHAFYAHLCQTDERRRNPQRADRLPAIPKRCVYEILTAAYDLYDRRAREHGALQRIPPPADGSQRLKVCGDTHGQLQDVLWIFDEHGEPSADNAYLFNGDIADRGKHAVEIFLLLLCFQLAEPTSVYINRGNHEQRDLNERPFSAGGGFAWEVRSKYPHDEHLVELWQRLFNALPVASVVGEFALVIHGGLFREPNITLEDIAKIDHRRPPPQQLKTRNDNMLFDSLWADPHAGSGVIVGSARGAFSATFGADVTRAFCARNGLKSVVRSHQLPKKQRGFEILHDAMLLTIFSASNYGGACRNKGGVLVFDEHGPAEVKEFYAPELAQLRAMFEFRAAERFKEQIALWRVAAMEGRAERSKRQDERERQEGVQVRWKHLLVKVDEIGELMAEDQLMVSALPQRWSVVTAHVYVEEEDDTLVADHEILARLMAELLKHKNSLTRSLLAAEHEESDAKASSAGAGGDAAAKPSGCPSQKHSKRRAHQHMLKHRSSRMLLRTVPYATWLRVLASHVPEFDESLWAEYGPRLLGSHAEPPVGVGGGPGPGTRVAYLAWLSRFAVELVYDSKQSFSASVAERLYSRLLASTRSMPMASLFAHLDPNHDGRVERGELRDCLAALDLGLSFPQLEQLVLALDLGSGAPATAPGEASAAGDRELELIEPVEAIIVLLEHVGPSVRRARKQTLTPSDASLDALRRRLGKRIRSNMETTVAALGSSAVQQLFVHADADGNGSALCDGKSPPSIDYCGFVQAFVVRDTLGELI